MRTLLLAAIAAAMVALSGEHAFAATPAALVVDDDKAQCANADFGSIRAAVVAADPGSVIRVCPGRYAEAVTVDKPLTLKGVPDAVAAVDCFQPTLPELAADQYVIVDPADAAPSTLTLTANDVDLAGFVLQGGATAITTAAGFSGYRVHHNLILANTVGAIFRSNGVAPSSLDHNCLRENGWGLANQWLPLINARIHHNSTFRIANFAYEQTGNCPEFLETGSVDACLESRIGMDRVAFDHNTSIGDDIAYRLASSASTRVLVNAVTAARIAIRLMGANQDLQIIDNQLAVRQVGLARQSNPPLASNIGALIEGNTITGPPGTGAGIGMGAGGLKQSQIANNVITGLDGEGIALLAGNTDNLIRTNTVTNNGSNGIRVATGATGNTFEANEMLGNGRIVTGAVDARDDARAFNVWRDNVCLTDNPDGSICGVDPPTGDH